MRLSKIHVTAKQLGVIALLSASFAFSLGWVSRLPLVSKHVWSFGRLKSLVGIGIIRMVGEDAANNKKRSLSDDDSRPAGDLNERSKEGTTNLEPALPSAFDLTMDIKDVDVTFLNSEKRLVRATADLFDELGLTGLSLHCRSNVPIGMACVGITPAGSTFEFFTRPSEGVISLGLWTRGLTPLLHAVPIIKTLFCIPEVGESKKDVPEPAMIWSHGLRGFRKEFSKNYNRDENPHESEDLGDMLETPDFYMKNEVVSTQTSFQRIDVYELMYPRFQRIDWYHKSLSGDGSYQSLHPELYAPDRVLYLNGVLQSSIHGDAQYHEALVHPAMMAHNLPKRAAIIGGGEGATLREVLKYNTVESVTMIEIDEKMVQVSKEYLPEWSDCSNIVGSTPRCFDDPRAVMKYEDALEWFIDRFAEDDDEDSDDEENSDDDENFDDEPFDIIIMDALDPQDNVSFADHLYKNENFIKALYYGLTDDGILAVQLGEAPKGTDPAEENANKNRAFMMNLLKEVGFKSMHVYEESHCGFKSPWSYLVAFKDYNTRANWYQSSAEVEIQIHQRLRRGKSDESLLRYFDGPTYVGYQLPPKAYEDLYCRKPDDTPYECNSVRGYYPEDINTPISHFEVRTSTVGEGAGRGLFASHDVSEDSMIAAEQGATAVHAGPSSWSTIMEAGEKASKEKLKYVENRHKSVFTYFEGYGWESKYLGRQHYVVESGVSMFVNHGCNGTYNSGTESEWTELDVAVNSMPPDFVDAIPCYSPVYERHLRQILSSGDCALRKIKAGEEILTNYLHFTANAGSWKNDMLELRAQCKGEGVGDITNYESAQDRGN